MVIPRLKDDWLENQMLFFRSTGNIAKPLSMEITFLKDCQFVKYVQFEFLDILLLLLFVSKSMMGIFAVFKGTDSECLPVLYHVH